MQSSLMKRSLLSFLDSSPIDQPAFYLEPVKKLKPCLKIEISDSFSEVVQPIPVSSSRASRAKFSFRHSLTIQTPKASTSSSPTVRDLSPYGLEFGKAFPESDTTYDNYYHQDGFCNIAMKKCHRRHMEDRATFEATSERSFFGIYDGHRNCYVSDYLQRNLHKMVLGHPELHEHPEKAFNETFARIDQEIIRNQERLNLQGGSTALCAVLDHETLHLANVGDSRAVLLRGDQAVSLNVEHRANNEEEKIKVESRGGFVFEKKGQTTSRLLVQGALELTRSIGDINYKQFISAEPDVFDFKLEKTDDYLLLASDGFWNELSEPEVVELVRKFGKTEGLSSFLVEEAVKRKHYNVDNITLIVIDVKHYLEMINANATRDNSSDEGL